MIEAIRNMGDLIDCRVPSDATAIVDFFDAGAPREITFGQMRERVSSVGSGLLSRGFKPGERVAILSRNHAAYVASFLGAMRVGLVPVPVNFKLPQSTLAQIFRDCSPRLIFADRERLALCPAGIEIVNFDDASAGFDAFLKAGEPPTHEPDDSSVAYMLYTSGSTGTPKGVVLSHAGQLWALRTLCKGFAGLDRFRAIAAAPLYHMNALLPSLLSLASGASIVLMPGFDARAYLQAVAHHKVNVLTSVPTMIVRLLKEADLVSGLDLKSVRMVMMGSAPTTEALIDETCRAFPGALVTNAYGTTEAGPAIFGLHPQGLPRPPLSIGYPLPDVAIRLVNGESADHGVLHVRTPALMLGYHNRPDETRARLQDGWYDTGDIARRDENGFIFFVGRADDMFVCGAENIYPAELEKILSSHSGVAQCCVVPANDRERGQVPIAFIVPRANARVTPEELKQHALTHGPAYMHPRQIHFRDELPLGGTNKIDRKSLMTLAQDAWNLKHGAEDAK